MQKSPTSKKKPEMPFSEALLEIVKGNKVTKKEWDNGSEYGFLKNGILYLHRNDKDHQWLVSEADIVGNDWSVL